jgi:hypothetical protein
LRKRPKISRISFFEDMQGRHTIPEDTECILSLVWYQDGNVDNPNLHYCLLKDGTETKEERLVNKGRVWFDLATREVNLDDFWTQWNPTIEKILEDTKNGMKHMSTLIASTGIPGERWFVRNQKGESASFTTEGPIQRNAPVIGHKLPNLPDYYADLYEMMKPSAVGIPAWVPPPAEEESSCSIS